MKTTILCLVSILLAGCNVTVGISSNPNFAGQLVQQAFDAVRCVGYDQDGRPVCVLNGRRVNCPPGARPPMQQIPPMVGGNTFYRPPVVIQPPQQRVCPGLFGQPVLCQPQIPPSFFNTGSMLNGVYSDHYRAGN